MYVKNKDDALDVVQEVAYRSFQKIDTLKNPQYFKTWILKIAINCAIDSVNRNKKVVELKPGFEEYIGSNDEDIPLSLSLQELLDVLQEEEKSVVLLKFYYEHTLINFIITIFATKDTTCSCVKSFTTTCSHDVAYFRNYKIDSPLKKFLIY